MKKMSFIVLFFICFSFINGCGTSGKIPQPSKQEQIKAQKQNIEPRREPGSKQKERFGLTYIDDEQTPFSGVLFTQYQSGKLRGEGSYKDGKHDGFMRAWHENGKLIMESNWKNGKLDGWSKDWDEKGNPIKVEFWKEGELVTTKRR